VDVAIIPCPTYWACTSAEYEDLTTDIPCWEHRDWHAAWAVFADFCKTYAQESTRAMQRYRLVSENQPRVEEEAWRWERLSEMLTLFCLLGVLLLVGEFVVRIFFVPGGPVELRAWEMGGNKSLSWSDFEGGVLFD